MSIQSVKVLLPAMITPVEDLFPSSTGRGLEIGPYPLPSLTAQTHGQAYGIQLLADQIQNTYLSHPEPDTASTDGSLFLWVALIGGALIGFSVIASQVVRAYFSIENENYRARLYGLPENASKLRPDQILEEVLNRIRENSPSIGRLRVPLTGTSEEEIEAVGREVLKLWEDRLPTAPEGERWELLLGRFQRLTSLPPQYFLMVRFDPQLGPRPHETFLARVGTSNP